jgi:PhnB protein
MPQTVVPYLTIKGAAEAIEFYKKAFGATENMRMPAQDGKRLMHADLTINGGSLFLSDEFPEHSEHGGTAAPSQGSSPPPVAVALALNAPADVDKTYKQAVAAGARGEAEPADQFWGARFAMLTDPFGHRWMLNAPLPETK